MTSLPGDVSIDLDLDAAERPADQIKPPFKTKIGGRVLTMKDPEDFDWQDLLDIQAPQDFLGYCLEDDDREHLLNLAMPGWKLNILMDKYRVHYGLDKKMKQAEREQRRGR